MRRTPLLILMTYCIALAPPASAATSTCYGSTSNGRLEHGVALPAQGSNFGPYTRLGAVLGRTYLHSTVHDIVLSAYRELERTHPGVTFTYGETGLRHGGPMPPHRTHETGTSVDFMVPLLGRDGRPAPFPSSAANRFGYDLEFDKAGRLDGYRIDFAAIAAHLRQLDRQARKRGTRIARVIFDPDLTRPLLGAPGGAEVASLPFMKSRPWVRHDEHYHVDFAVRCAPLKDAPR